MNVGLVIVTYNRPEYFRQVLRSIIDTDCGDVLNNIVIVNDGTPYPHCKELFEIGEWKDDMANSFCKTTTLNHKRNFGVATAKNNGLRELYHKTDVEHFFVIEDDILIKNKDVFTAYIEASDISGLKHFCYALHGPANKLNKKANPKLTLNYKDGVSVSLYEHCVGAFCYYHRSVFDKVGFMDEKLVNAWEHCLHTYEIYKEGLCTPFWWIPDITDSEKYLSEIACSEDSSVIRPREDWRTNISKGAERVKGLIGYYPWEIPVEREEIVIGQLKNMKLNEK